MRIAVLSDFHLGDGGPTDRFCHDDAEFGGFLGRLERDFERIVLLGDIWETLASRRYGDAAASLHAARAAHPELARRLAGPRYTYVYGNHDLVAGRMLGAKGGLAIHADGVRLFLTHGHAFDRGWRKGALTGAYGFWAVGWLMRLGLRAVVRKLDHLPNWLGGVGEDPEKCSFQRAALAVARRRSFDVMVTGHTHLGGAHEHGHHLLLNSGSCHWGRRAFLEIDTRAGVYEYRAAG